ncbi:hypothetical protein KUTeg_001107 [Tegillarca granosa]|uniref:Uncharacterized protein n=1 Tax=Tegillarca granosa TaxID=220873 RepID=A0ABQ9FX89_TEGGR|nr:hypothetical protein KUTeg_001107 [Tegillarca granosa]
MHGVVTTPGSLPAINDHLIYSVSKRKQVGHKDPTAKADRLSYILRGIKKSQHNIPKTRLPITSHILQQLCALLQQGCFSPYVDLILDSSKVDTFQKGVNILL